MLEEILSSHVLGYHNEGVNVGACLVSTHVEVKLKRRALTRPINPKAITPKCKDLAAGFIHHGLREVLRLTDMLDEFHGDLLDKLECRLPRLERSVRS